MYNLPDVEFRNLNQTDNKCEQKVESFVSTAFGTKMIISFGTQN